MPNDINTYEKIGAEGLLDRILDGDLNEFVDDRVKEIREYGLSYKKIKKVHCPNLTSISTSGFEHNEIEEIDFAEDFPKLTAIGQYGFASNNIRNLTNIDVVSSYIGDNAFGNNPLFGDYELPGSGHYASIGIINARYKNFENITTFNNPTTNADFSLILSFPKITNIGNVSFCLATYYLKALIIGTNNGDVVCSLNGVPALPNNPTNGKVFQRSGVMGYGENGFIYVPDNLLSDYKNATNWSLIADRIRPISYFDFENMFDLYLDNNTDIHDSWDVILENHQLNNYEQYVGKEKWMKTDFGWIKMLCVASDKDIKPVQSSDGTATAKTSWISIKNNADYVSKLFTRKYNGSGTKANVEEHYVDGWMPDASSSRTWRTMNYNYVDEEVVNAEWEIEALQDFSLIFNYYTSNSSGHTLTFDSVIVKKNDEIVFQSSNSTPTTRDAIQCTVPLLQGETCTISIKCTHPAQSRRLGYVQFGVGSSYNAKYLFDNQYFSINTTFDKCHRNASYYSQSSNDFIGDVYEKQKDSLDAIFNALPLNISNNIATVKKVSFYFNEFIFGYYSENLATIWIPSCYEVAGNNSYTVNMFDGITYTDSFSLSNNPMFINDDSTPYICTRDIYNGSRPYNIHNSSVTGSVSSYSNCKYIFGFCLD